jgi:Arc/MetJ family transcription regulator
VSERLAKVPAMITVDVKYGDAVLATAKKMVLVSEAQETIEQLLREALEASRFGTLGLHTSVTLEQEYGHKHETTITEPDQPSLHGS